jgi:hypothetical protein
MPYSNPITDNELRELALNNPLHPRDGSAPGQYMPPAYFLVPPATQAGPVKWRLFDAAYISTGIIDPNRLGTGATGAGNLYLADDGTWKAIGGGGGGDMYKCFHPDTELLTLNGWKKITDISFNDEVATLNQETKELEYQVPNHIFKYEYDGELLGRETKQLSYLVTPNHRMYVRKWYGGQRGLVWSENFHWERADEVSEKTRSFPITAKWNGVKTETNPFGIDDDLFLEFLGWFLAEGCVVKSRIYVTQTKSTTLADCTKVMVEMARSLERTLRHHQNAHFNFRHSELAKFLSQFGKHAHNKFIPSFVKNLPPEKLILFYSAYYKGDGHLNSNNITTVSKRMADDLQEIILKLGGYATITKCSPTITSYGVRDFYRLNCNFNNLQGSTAKKDNYKIDYKGFVHCVEVDNSTLYTRFNGKPVFLGNSTYDTDNSGIVDKAEALMTLGRNSTGATLYKGTVIRIEGSTGNRPNFVKAQGNNDANSAQTFGVIATDINNNSDGYAIVQGTLHDLDTRTGANGAANPFTDVTLADGDLLFLHPTIPGYITNIKPLAPQHLVYVGVVTRTSPTNGTIVYRIQNGYELYELHDVAINGKANNDLLVYESSTNLWKNKTISAIFGGTPLVTVPTLAQVTTAGNTTTNAINIGLITTTTSAVGNMFVANGANNTSLTLANDSFGRATIRVKGNLSATSAAGAYFTAEGYQEAWFNVIARAANTGNKYWRFGNIGAGGVNNIFAIQKLTEDETAIALTALAIASSSGNVLINSTTDAGFKFDVNGTGRFSGNVQITGSATNSLIVRGSGATSATNAFVVQNSSGTSLFTIGDTGAITATQNDITTNFVFVSGIQARVNQSLPISAPWSDSQFVSIETIANKAQVLIVRPNANLTLTSGTHDTQRITHTVAPTSGTAVINGLTLNQTINQTGGANGITRGIYVNPTITAAADFRAIETTVGKVILGSTSGNVLIGTTTDAGFRLDVNGTGRYQNALTVYDNFNILRSTFLTDVFNIFSSNNSGISTPGRGQFIISHGSREVMRAHADRTVFFNGNVIIGPILTNQNTQLQVFGSVTAASSIAQGVLFNNTLVAAANNDVLVGLDINPTFTNGAFIGVSNVAIRATGGLRFSSSVLSDFQFTGANSNWTALTITNTNTGGRSWLIGASALNGTVGNSNFFINDATAGLTRLTINANGHLGIGTTNPSYPLHVGGAAVSLGSLSSGGSVNATAFLGGGLYIGTQSTTNAVVFSMFSQQQSFIWAGWNGSNIAERMRLTEASNLLLGTTTDAGYKLDVSGTGRFTSTLTANSFVKSGGTSSQFLKADGSVDTNTYLTSYTETDTLQSVTNRGATTTNAIEVQSIYIGRGGGNVLQNIAIGSGALSSNISGSDLTVVGYQAGLNNTGVGNDFFGSRTGYTNTTGLGNVYIGTYSGYYESTANYNTYIGNSAGGGLSSGSSTSGNNVAIGRLAGNNSSGGDNVFLGHSAGRNSTISNRLIIGNRNNASLIEGNFSTGNVMIGTSTDAGYKLDVNGTTRIQSTLNVIGNASIGTLTNPVRFLVGAKVIDDNGFTYDTNSAMVVHQTGTSATTLNDPKEVLVLARQGTAGQAYGAAAAFEISRYENSGTASKTRLDVKLADGSFLEYNTRVMTMLSNGNVGIGTTSPASKLDVNGTVSLSGFPFAFSAAGESNLNIITRPDGQVAMYIISGVNPQTAYQNIEHIFRNLSGNVRLAIRSTGNVIVGGYTDSGYKLDVVGGDINVSGAYRVGGAPGYTGVITIPANPPGMQNIQVNGGIITGVF